jgi:hypothetical protein
MEWARSSWVMPIRKRKFRKKIDIGLAIENGFLEVEAKIFSSLCEGQK